MDKKNKKIDLKLMIIILMFFLIGFLIGYFFGMPNHITLDLNIDDDFVTVTEIQKEMMEIQHNCKPVIKEKVVHDCIYPVGCSCDTPDRIEPYWYWYNITGSVYENKTGWLCDNTGYNCTKLLDLRW